MTPEELAVFGRRLHGSRAWRTKLAAALGVPRSTVWRWAQGEHPIPPIAEQLIKMKYAALKAQRAQEQALK